MEIGIQIPTPGAEAGRDGYQRIFELCELAEELGYGFASVGNHRFSPDSLDPSAPFVVLGGVASRTRRLRLLTSVLLLPLCNPIEVAEQIATLDVMSGGRAILGIGIGYRPYEFGALGLRFRQRGSRTEEAIEVMRRAWGAEPMSFEGRRFRFASLDVRPKPIQAGGPPIWIGAGARAGIDRAARLGDGWLVSWMLDRAAVISRAAKYRAAAEASGRPATVCIMRKVGIRPTRQLVEDEWLPGALGILGHYTAASAGRYDGAAGAPPTPSLDPTGAGQVVAGTPDDCIRQIQTMRKATGCEQFHASFGSGPVARYSQADHAEVIASMRLFAQEVLPVIT